MSRYCSTNLSIPFDTFEQFYPLLYSFPSTLLYIMVIYLIHQQTGYFAKVYIHLFTNLVCWWLEFFFNRIIGFPFLCSFWMSTNNTFWLSIPYFTLCSLTIACFISTTVISIYQMTAIVFPITCEQIFKKRLRLIYIIMIIVPFFDCSHILVSVITMIPLSKFVIYCKVTHIYKELDLITVSLTNVIVGISSLMVIFFCLIISAVRYWQIRKANHGVVRMRIFLINVYLCLSTTIFIVFQFIIFHAHVIEENYILLGQVYKYQDLLADISYLPIPFFIILVNRRVRRAIIHRYFKLKTKPDFIKFYNYPLQTHKIITKDGYILTIFRIPYGRDPRPAPNTSGKRPVMLLWHGLLGDSCNFVLNPPTSGAGFVFADAGFDVWIANCRGTKYGRRHLTLSDKDHAFWNFTWYDHASRDLPDTVDYILKQTEQENLYYVGHSQGTLMMFAKLADDNGDFGKKIKQFYAMGPIGGLSKMANFLDVFSDGLLYQFGKTLLENVGDLPLMLPDNLHHQMSQVCLMPIIGKVICEGMLTILDGLEKNTQYNSSRTSIYFNHFPAATSTLNIVYWLQTIHDHYLTKPSYGAKKNLEMYGQEQPPRFNVSLIKTPTYLYFSDDDVFTTGNSTKEYLVSRLGTALKGSYDLDHFTHFDFVIGLRATDEVYRPIIRSIYEDLQFTNPVSSANMINNILPILLCVYQYKEML